MIKNTEHTLLLSLFNYLCAVEAKKNQTSRNQEDQQKDRIKLCMEPKKDFFRDSGSCGRLGTSAEMELS